MKLLPVIFSFTCLPFSLLAAPSLEVVLDSSQVKNPFGVAFDKKGNAYIAEYKGGRIHRLGADGTFTLLSGNGEQGFAGNGLLADKAVYNGVHNLVCTSNADMYISDTRNNLIRKINGKTGIVSTIAGVPGKKGFAGDGGPASTHSAMACTPPTPNAHR